MATVGVAGETHVADQTIREALPVKLDTLLEQYLHLLDHYQSTREDLSRALSLGFIGLAQANFNATNKIRYGQDHYDQRMKALRVVDVKNSTDDSSVSFAVVPNKASKPSQTMDSVEKPQEVEKENKTSAESIPEQASSDHDAVQTNPLRWFGILVPQALRSAQAQFVDVVEHNVAQLASIDAQMKLLEIEIRRIKKQISKARP